jgi:hypothetical protein
MRVESFPMIGEQANCQKGGNSQRDWEKLRGQVRSQGRFTCRQA